MSKKISFEQSLEKLEGIIEKLEAGDLSLDEVLKDYKDGINVLRECYAILESVEKKVQILVRNEQGKPILKDFDVGKGNTSETESQSSED